MPTGSQTILPSQEKRRVVGEWRLDQREDSPNWYRVRYDSEKKTYVWLSLRVTDFEEAYVKLLEIVAANPTEKRLDPSEVKLFDTLTWYWENHAKNLSSAPSVRTSIGYWRGWWKTNHKVDDVTPINVNKFVQHLRSSNLSEGYISRILRVGRAALNGYRDNLLVTWVPKIKDNQTQADKDEADPKGRPLSLEELAKLVRYASEPHLLIFIAIMLNTICRPSAALELAGKQVDFERGRVQLNPEGRRQTKKWRPELPLTGSLRAVLLKTEAEQRKYSRNPVKFKMGRYVLFGGKPIKSIKKAWRTMVRNAGFVVPVADLEDEYQNDEITPYSLRHTMARVLREARVYEEERNVFLGHKRKGSARTGAMYAPDDPVYLAEPAAVIDAFMEKLEAEIRRQVAEIEEKTAA